MCVYVAAMQTNQERFRVHYRPLNEREWVYGQCEPTEGLAMSWLPTDYQAATLLRDSGGKDHPDNAGKFFLKRILK